MTLSNTKAKYFHSNETIQDITKLGHENQCRLTNFDELD